MHHLSIYRVWRPSDHGSIAGTVIRGKDTDSGNADNGLISGALHHGCMPTTERSVDRGRRLGRLDLVRVGTEIRHARTGSGLSLAAIGRSVGLSASQVSRIERGLAPSTTVLQLAIIGAAVGLDIRTRTYPGPDPLRDVAQQRLLDRLRPRLHPRLRMRAEVLIAGDSEQRAWDAWVDAFDPAADPAIQGLAVEAETRIADGQAFLRRLALKMSRGGVNAVLVVVADTRVNRASVAAMRLVAFDAFPITPRQAFDCLAAGRHPGGSALVFL